MTPEPLAAAAQSVASISNYWQVIALAVIGVFGLLALWITRVGAESKKLVTKSDELEKERTAHRAATRDAQFAAQDGKIATVEGKIDGLGRSFDKHITDHRERDSRTEAVIQRIFDQLNAVSNSLRDMVPKREFDELIDNFHRMDKTLVEIYTLLKGKGKPQ